VTISDGLYLVGTGSEPGVPRIAPGIWEAAGPVTGDAYWYVGHTRYGISDHELDVPSGGTGPLMTAVIPPEAYSFETQGFGTWTRTGDVPVLSVKMPGGSWRVLTTPHADGPRPLNLKLWSGAAWRHQAVTGLIPLKVRMPGGTWLEVARFDYTGQAAMVEQGFSWQVPDLSYALSDASSSGYPWWPTWELYGIRDGDPSHPSGLGWWGTMYSSVPQPAWPVSAVSHAEVSSLGGMSRYMLRHTHLLDLDLVRYMIRAYDPGGVLTPQVRFSANPVMAESGTGGSSNSAAQSRLWLADDVPASYPGFRGWGPADPFPGYARPAAPDRETLPRAVPTGPGDEGTLIHTFTGDPGATTWESVVYPLDMGALAGMRHVGFIHAVTDPVLDPAGVPLGDSLTREAASSLGMSLELVP
jgi:hypothetical protein